MKLSDYFEAKILDVTDLKDLSDYTIILFDTESNGLLGSQGLKLTTGKYYDEKEKRTRNTYGTDELHIAEIGAIAYNFSTKKRSKFHTFIKANLDKKLEDGRTIKELIHWSDIKEAGAKDIKSQLIAFEAWLNKFDKKIIVAHNGKAFDFKVMRLIAEKFGRTSLKETFTENSDANTILVDTKLTGSLRKELAHLPWPTGSNGDKVFAVNNQEALIKMFGINNGMAHTAIEDVKALGKFLLRIGKELKK